MQKANSKTPA